MNPAKRQLLLVKYLYKKGEDALDENGPYSAGLAVSLFQDAVELLLWATAIHVEAKDKPAEKFDAMWDAVGAAPKCPDGKTLPLRSAMTSLNKARVNFKHYGNLPNDKDVRKFQTYTEEFLTAVFADFFAEDFSTISMVDLIQSEDVALHLRQAESALAASDPVVALEECSRANYILTAYIGRILPPIKGRRYEDDDDAPFGDPNPTWEVDPDIKDLRKETEKLGKGLGVLRNVVIAASLKIPLADVMEIQKILPQVSSYAGGMYDVSSVRPSSHKEEDARFAIEYLVRFTIALEASLNG